MWIRTRDFFRRARRAVGRGPSGPSRPPAPRVWPPPTTGPSPPRATPASMRTGRSRDCLAELWAVFIGPSWHIGGAAEYMIGHRASRAGLHLLCCRAKVLLHRQGLFDVRRSIIPLCEQFVFELHSSIEVVLDGLVCCSSSHKLTTGTGLIGSGQCVRCPMQCLFSHMWQRRRPTCTGRCTRSRQTRQSSILTRRSR